MPKRLLTISNGHGEDNHTSHVIRTLRQLCPDLDIAAQAVVGEGLAYRTLDVPIVGPTQVLPSGGFTYVNRLLLIDDFRAGLLGLTWRQLQAVRRHAKTCDLVFATGDVVGQCFAYLSGKPFVSFISPLSSMYEGHLNMDLILWRVLRSPRCLTVFTRDPHTAKNLASQGLDKVQFGGIPSLDRLVPRGKDIALSPDVPQIALLPGSRLPEAERNFQMQLRLIEFIGQIVPRPEMQFRAALVPGLMERVAEVAAGAEWASEPVGDRAVRLTPPALNSDLNPDRNIEVLCYSDAFSDIVCSCTLVIGMAGLAVDQAVAIGKPVIQLAGEGPQFTYAFAEAQQRLLGLSSQTFGLNGAATDADLQVAARRTVETIQDADYLARCFQHGRDRFGPPGASTRIASAVLEALGIEIGDRAA
ncbi:MAG: lipid-A-disaccharide synthase-related protein [Cyanobacteria bacterium J06639_1]